MATPVRKPSVIPEANTPQYLAQDTNKQRKEIYTYETPWMIYAMAWSNRRDKKFRLALGSFMEEYNNKVEIVSLNDEKNAFEKTASFDHPYPATKVMFNPDTATTSPDLIATSGDYLRLWQIGANNTVTKKCDLNNVSVKLFYNLFFV